MSLLISLTSKDCFILLLNVFLAPLYPFKNMLKFNTYCGTILFNSVNFSHVKTGFETSKLDSDVIKVNPVIFIK